MGCISTSQWVVTVVGYLWLLGNQGEWVVPLGSLIVQLLGHCVHV